MRSLAVIENNLQEMMQTIDELEEITDDKIDEFLSLKEERALKIDNWISYIDNTKQIVATLKERRDRFQKAYKAAQSLQQRLKERIKYHIKEDKTGMKFSGKELGTLYLHKNPKSVAHLVPLTEKTLYNVISDPYYLDVCKEYTIEISMVCLDLKRVKEDLLAGRELSWATIEQGSHVRVKG